MVFMAEHQTQALVPLSSRLRVQVTLVSLTKTLSHYRGNLQMGFEAVSLFSKREGFAPLFLVRFDAC